MSPLDYIFDAWAHVPYWAWIFAAVCVLHYLALVGAIAFPYLRRGAERHVTIGETTIELWVRERRMPGPGEAILVPVATDLKMVYGIAKWVRDATADAVQREASAVAPLPVGEAFVGGGGKFRFGLTALAVVMDDMKRTSPEWIRQAVGRAFVLARARGADVIIVPDFTEDLLRQPQTITDEQRRTTAAPIARAVIDGILDEADTMEVVRIWVWRKEYADIYREELERLRRTTTWAAEHPGHTATA